MAASIASRTFSKSACLCRWKARIDELVSHASVDVIEGAGHAVVTRHTALVAERFDSFLDEHSATGQRLSLPGATDPGGAHSAPAARNDMAETRPDRAEPAGICSVLSLGSGRRSVP